MYDVFWFVAMNIIKISNFYNFLLYIINDINGQSCVLTEGEKNHKKGGWIVFLETSSFTF